MQDFNKIQENKAKAIIAEQVAIEKAMRSTDVDEIFKAQQYFNNNLKQKDDSVDVKSILIDPMELHTSFGYKDKPFNVSYDILRAMSRTHIVKSIIETRKEQISSFCEPQIDRSKPGFIIRKKQSFFEQRDGGDIELSDEDKKNIESLIEFILNCGSLDREWSGDDFDTFVRKIIGDSLSLDQATFEIVRNKGGVPVEFLATDAATYRLADSYNEQGSLKEKELIKGYAPSYVQLYQSRILAEYYPWELCLGIRNPSTNIHSNGYGRSELEDMIQTVTAILNADYYNANFFKVGSSPKGILRYSGNINPNTIEDFRRQWIAQVTGVANMHKIPLINADKLDFINTHTPNKDMEFSKYQEFLIKISCAMYKIDPSEVGFPMSGSSDSNPMIESGNKEKLEYSKDKGLKPLLKKVQKWLNRFVISQIDRRYELIFVGLEDEEEDKLIERNIKEVSNYKTLNEVRKSQGLDPIDGGDVILNPVFIQAQAMAMQGGDAANDFVDQYDQEDDEQQEDENPFVKSLERDLETMLN